MSISVTLFLPYITPRCFYLYEASCISSYFHYVTNVDELLSDMTGNNIILLI